MRWSCVAMCVALFPSACSSGSSSGGSAGATQCQPRVTGPGAYVGSFEPGLPDEGGRADHIVAQASGDLLLGGEVDGDNDIGGGTLAGVMHDGGFLGSFGSDGAHRWSLRLCTPTADEECPVAGIGTDDAGNAYVAANVTASVDLGQGELAPLGMDDVVVASRDPAGAPRWSRRLGDAGHQHANAVVADADGVVVVVQAHAAFTLDGLALEDGQTALARFDDTGNSTWRTPIVGTVDLHAMARTNDGALVVGGCTADPIVDFGCASISKDDGARVPFVARYSGGGACEWAVALGPPDSNACVGEIAALPSGDVAVIADVREPLVVAGTPVEHHGDQTILAARVTPSGALVWHVSWYTKYAFGDGQSYGIAADPDGNVIVVGTGEGEQDLGGGPLENWDLPGNTFTGGDQYVVSFDADGSFRWGVNLSWGGSFADVSFGSGAFWLAGRRTNGIPVGDCVIGVPASEISVYGVLP